MCSGLMKLDTHGDVKPSTKLANEFARVVIRQILKTEEAAKFLWRDIYMQTRRHLIKASPWEVLTVIWRALQAHQLPSFMVP